MEEMVTTNGKSRVCEKVLNEARGSARKAVELVK